MQSTSIRNLKGAINISMSNERGSVTILIALLAAVILALGLSFNWLVKEHIRSSESLRDKSEPIIKPVPPN